MRTVLLSVIALSLAFFVAVACAGEDEVVTSEKLTLDDVRASVMAHMKKNFPKSASLIKIYGIHQTGENSRTAQIYFSMKLSDQVKEENYVVNTLVRFNSGKWFNTEVPGFVVRKAK